MVLTMNVVILAAGRGTRLRPLTSYIPKVLLPVCGRPILDYIVEIMVASKYVDHVFIAVSDHLDAVSRYLEQRDYGGRLRLAPVQALAWETGGDLRLAIEQIGIDEDFLVCNGDVFSPISIDRMVEFHNKCAKERGTVATVMLKHVPGKQASRHGLVELAGDLVTRFEEKPKSFSKSRAVVNAGYYVFGKMILDERDKYLPAKRSKLEHSVLTELAKKRLLAGFVPDTPYWIDVGTMEAYIAAQTTMLRYRGPPEPNDNE
jgi:NDP-sugar pyrophosphorylase family protein